MLLAVLWVVPLSLKRQQRLYVACEVSTSWAALDVFAVGVVAALLEISKFAQFMVGHRCDALNRFLGKHLDRALAGDDKCFDVSTELTRGAWVLLPAAFVSGVVGVAPVPGEGELDERVGAWGEGRRCRRLSSSMRGSTGQSRATVSQGL